MMSFNANSRACKESDEETNLYSLPPGVVQQGFAIFHIEFSMTY